MSSDRIVTAENRLTPPVQPTPDAPGSYSAYGLSTYYGEVIGMLRLRFQDDTWRALPYYGLSSMSYEPALGIELSFAATLVRLRGRNLFPLFNLIGDHSVRWVWEADRAAYLQTPEAHSVIERIEYGVAKGHTP